MRALARIGLIAVAGCVALPALAATSTTYSRGGRTTDFAADVQKYRQSGELFRITGRCQSACTMFLSLPNACVEPSARLLFHAARTPRGTSDMINSYNGKLRACLTAKGVMERSAFHTISGRDVISKFGYRRCPQASVALLFARFHPARERAQERDEVRLLL